MTEIKIGPKAKIILQSFSGINPEMRLREDYLYTRGTDSGTVAGTFNLPKNEVTTQELALGSVSEFLGVMSMFDESKLTINLDGDALKLKDSKKSITYTTAPLSIVAPRNTAGEKLYDASDKIIMQFIVDEETKKELSDAIKKLSLGKLTVVSEAGKIKIKAINETTDNSIEFDVDGSANEDRELTFGVVGTFDMLLNGIYAVQIREIDVNGRGVAFAKLVNSTINANKAENGELYYFASLS
jgi:hypothetical protein